MENHEVKNMSQEDQNKLIDEMNENYTAGLNSREMTAGYQVVADVNEENEFVIYEQGSLDLEF